MGWVSENSTCVCRGFTVGEMLSLTESRSHTVQSVICEINHRLTFYETMLVKANFKGEFPGSLNTCHDN